MSLSNYSAAQFELRWTTMTLASLAWRPRQALARLACGVLLLIALGGARADSLFDVNAGGWYDTNLTRARHREDYRADAALSTLLSAGRVIVPTGSDTVVFSGNMLAESFQRYSPLDHVELGGSIAYK